MLCAVLVLSFCVAVATSTTVVDKKLYASPLTTAPTTPSPQATPRTSTRLTTYTVPTTRQSTTTTTTADDVRPLSECAVPTFSMSLRSARNSSGVWTDEVESADAVEQGSERQPGGYRLDVQHTASYSCGGGESVSLTLTLTAPVLPLPSIGKL
ncbi:uncharacterized protein LOC126455689 [Schistocerca serialis cubense]|uniref:uncharacterized protein LOC126455689 n=1 Tax=Schistocerca serialis cubense TaxID=2023355 RepID=UPI00214ED42A|nr:uncharacterized protein LOC126455689 [Schistocerca serialis cubense]XP_049947413.1 uncharacterized protein LOC126455689 [Schistocerca serialis cubense]